MFDHTCLIGKFGIPGCNKNKFIAELKSMLPESVFPWTEQQLVFHPARTDLQYIFDVNMQKIAQGYEDSNNEAGFLSLISVTYNIDTFSSAHGLYGKVLLRSSGSGSIDKTRYSELYAKVFFAMNNHVPLQKEQKIKINLTSDKLPAEMDIPSSIRKFWMKAIVEYKGNITQHIFFGTKGESRKVHVFCRTGEHPKYENTSKHVSPEVAPFKQFDGIVVQNGITHSFHINPEEIKPHKKGTETE